MTDRISTHADGCWEWGPAHYGCAVGEIERLQAEVKQLRADLMESDEIREKLGHLLTRTATALKGEPPEGTWHSWHDLPEKATQLVEALAKGPTPGPWAACHTNSGTFVKSERLAGYFVEVRHCRTAQDVNADAHLIAACDPDTIRALLAERDALAAKVASYERAEREINDALNMGNGSYLP